MGRKRNKITGDCLCGTVQFTVSIPIKWCAHCHCTRCRRSHGAGFVTWFGVNKRNFKLKSGNDHLSWYHSSEKSQYGFCINCGSSIFFKSKKWKNEIHITLANLENDHGIIPTAHVYFDTHVDWVPTDERLEQFADPKSTD